MRLDPAEAAEDDQDGSAPKDRKGEYGLLVARDAKSGDEVLGVTLIFFCRLCFSLSLSLSLTFC